MLSGDKHIKNSMTDTNTSLTDISFPIAYTKTNKLITALYMVTDIMEKEEPIRAKLRSLGIEILSDPEGLRYGGAYGASMSITRIEQIISFLNIASAMNFISDMNCSILTKEFVELRKTIQDKVETKPSWLEEFLFEDKSIGQDKPSNGQEISTRIGVQKGSTLMKALSNKTRFLSHNHGQSKIQNMSRAEDFNIIKQQRRDRIINILKNNGGNASIKDIRVKINIGAPDALVCSEKTLQRELMSMTKDGVLYKTGEKRWTQYGLQK